VTVGHYSFMPAPAVAFRLQVASEPTPQTRGFDEIADPARFKASGVDQSTGGRSPERSPTLACDPGLRRKKGAKPRFGRVGE